MAPQVHDTRAKFTELLAINPNHFGTMPESGLKAIFPKSGDTTFEQLSCVGYNPDRRMLEATFEVKLSAGYGGRLCSNGSREFVRFFIDYGSGFVDAAPGPIGALVATTVHDLPDSKDCAGLSIFPLTYSATLGIAPDAKICSQPVLPRVRAILSWQVVPPLGNAHWVPVWGNVLDVHVQIKPRFPILWDIVHEIEAELGKPIVVPHEFEALAPQPIAPPDPTPVAIADLVALYGVSAKSGAS